MVEIVNCYIAAAKVWNLGAVFGSVISEVCDDPAVPAYVLHICGIMRMPG